jgi:hypothetical protein
MVKIDFITLANIIFKDKDKYKFVSDEEKENNFFVLNKKFAFKYLRQAQFFNNKNIDKAAAIDIWYQIFYKTTNGTPQWWWLSKQKAKEKIKSEINKNDIELIKEYYSFTDNDIKFLTIFFIDKLKEDIKRIKKFKK